MISLVLDQSTRAVGFAVLDTDKPMVTERGILTGSLLQHGVITTRASSHLMDRLNVIRADIGELIRAYAVEEIVIENTGFFSQTGGRAHNASVLAAVNALIRDLAKERKLPLYKQSPNTIKKEATGYGGADKEDVKGAVCILWEIARHNLIDDNHADALAGAYTWLHRGPGVRATTKEKGVKPR